MTLLDVFCCLLFFFLKWSLVGFISFRGGVEGVGTAHRAVKSRCPLPRSGHGGGLGYVTGGQACQGHLDCGALLGSSLRWRCFAGAQSVAGVPPSSADDHAAAAPVLQHGPAAHLVHQTVDLFLMGTQIKQVCWSC